MTGYRLLAAFWLTLLLATGAGAAVLQRLGPMPDPERARIAARVRVLLEEVRAGQQPPTPQIARSR